MKAKQQQQKEKPEEYLQQRKHPPHLHLGISLLQSTLWLWKKSEATALTLLRPLNK